MNRINTSPMVQRIVAFVIAAIVALVLMFSSPGISEAHKKGKRHHHHKRGGKAVVCNAPLTGVAFNSGLVKQYSQCVAFKVR